METSPLIWGANQWTGFYMITASVMKGLMKDSLTLRNNHCLYYSLFNLNKNMKLTMKTFKSIANIFTMVTHVLSFLQKTHVKVKIMTKTSKDKISNIWRFSKKPCYYWYPYIQVFMSIWVLKLRQGCRKW